VFRNNHNLIAGRINSKIVMQETKKRRIIHFGQSIYIQKAGFPGHTFANAVAWCGQASAEKILK
jgi:hypothetical protein